MLQVDNWETYPWICMWFQWLRACPCGFQHLWGHFFAPAVALWGGGCLMRRGFRTVSDRKGLGAGNAARDACWDWNRSVGLMGNKGYRYQPQKWERFEYQLITHKKNNLTCKETEKNRQYILNKTALPSNPTKLQPRAGTYVSYVLWNI